MSLRQQHSWTINCRRTIDDDVLLSSCSLTTGPYPLTSTVSRLELKAIRRRRGLQGIRTGRPLAFLGASLLAAT